MKVFTSYHSSSSLSSSSLSSSSSTLCLDPTLCNSNNATTTAGCISAILRRILCSGSLPTHPSDQIRELDSVLSSKEQELKAKQNTEANINTLTSVTNTTSTISAPGIVAKLMGLEGNLEIPFESTQRSSLSRSQSTNSVDYLGESKKKMQGKHRRVKSSSSSSSSSCELPSFHLHENENFLELRFESSGRSYSRELKSKGKKKKGSFSAQELKRNNKREKVFGLCSVNGGNDCEFQEVISNTCSVNTVSSDENEYFFNPEDVDFSQPLKVKEVFNGEKVKRGKKKGGRSCCTEKKVEFVSECSSEDSSPVSVFDFAQREALDKGVDSLGVGLSWKRELTPELENELLFVLHSDYNLMVEERKVQTIENKKKERSKKKENQNQDYSNIWGEICKLVEDDFVGSNQIKEPEGMRKQGEFDSISEDFESEIFYHLLNELIDELVLISS